MTNTEIAERIDELKKRNNRTSVFRSDKKTSNTSSLEAGDKGVYLH